MKYCYIGVRTKGVLGAHDPLPLLPTPNPQISTFIVL